MMRLCIKQSRNISRIQGNLIERTLRVALFIIIGIVLLSDSGLTSNGEEKGTFDVGLKIVDFEYEKPNGKKEIVTTAIWYPTVENPRSYTYYENKRKGGGVESRVALDASITQGKCPYPLILYAHGAFGTGYNGAYFAEYLAARGYIIVGPDYIDTKPPDYRQQIAFNRIKEGNVGNPLSVLKVAGQFVQDMAEDRDFFLDYLVEHRLNHTSFIIDEMIKLNKDVNSPFYQTINEKAIGICGHSEGGLTVLGKIGAYPDKKFKDDRIKAALVFSAPGYPFENTANGISIPVMFMAGDKDTPAVHPEISRRTLYDKAKPPKFYLVLKDATHFTFGNKGCGQLPLYQAVEDKPQTNAICRYGLAFFEKYLCGNLSAGKQLDTQDSAWVYYVKEEKPGEVLEWGKEPPPSQGGAGGIREEFMGKRGKEGRLKRWQDRNRGSWFRKGRNRAYEEQETWE